MSKPNLVQPYLFFGGRCEEALEFYGKALGAKTEMLMRYSEAPEQPPAGMLAQGFEKKVMHSSFRVGDSVLMASDGCGPDDCKFSGFSLSYAARDEADAERAFAALTDGGTVTMPLGKTFWALRFGMGTDRFGLGWMVNLEA
jgi:PhnB protein